MFTFKQANKHSRFVDGIRAVIPNSHSLRSMQDSTRNSVHKVEGWVTSRPFVSLILATLCGIVLGWMAKRSRSTEADEC